MAGLLTGAADLATVNTGTTSTATVNVPIPTGAAVGDLLVIAAFGGTSISNPPVMQANGPGGAWSIAANVRRVSTDSTTIFGAVFYRQLTAADLPPAQGGTGPTSPTVGVRFGDGTTGGGRWAATIARTSGLTAAALAGATVTQTNVTNVATGSCPAITTTGPAVVLHLAVPHATNPPGSLVNPATGGTGSLVAYNDGYIAGQTSLTSSWIEQQDEPAARTVPAATITLPRSANRTTFHTIALPYTAASTAAGSSVTTGTAAAAAAAAGSSVTTGTAATASLVAAGSSTMSGTITVRVTAAGMSTTSSTTAVTAVASSASVTSAAVTTTASAGGSAVATGVGSATAGAAGGSVTDGVSATVTLAAGDSQTTGSVAPVADGPALDVSATLAADPWSAHVSAPTTGTDRYSASLRPDPWEVARGG